MKKHDASQLEASDLLRSGGLSLRAYSDVLNGGRTDAVVKPGDSGTSRAGQRIRTRRNHCGQDRQRGEGPTRPTWSRSTMECTRTSLPRAPCWCSAAGTFFL